MAGNDSLAAAVKAALGKTTGKSTADTAVRQVESGALKSSSKSGAAFA